MGRPSRSIPTWPGDSTVVVVDGMASRGTDRIHCEPAKWLADGIVGIADVAVCLATSGPTVYVNSALRQLEAPPARAPLPVPADAPTSPPSQVDHRV